MWRQVSDTDVWQKQLNWLCDEEKQQVSWTGDWFSATVVKPSGLLISYWNIAYNSPPFDFSFIPYSLWHTHVAALSPTKVGLGLGGPIAYGQSFEYSLVKSES